MQLDTDQELNRIPVDTAPNTGSGLLAMFGGLFGKAAETAIDIYGASEKAKIVGSVYPTGQTNPAQVQASVAAQQQAESAQLKQYMLIGGGVLAALLVVVLVVRRK